MSRKKIQNSRRVKHEVRPNSFEKKINRTKNAIFGKKKPKIELGSPGYSRHQGYLKRKKLLSSQLKNMESCNRYSDRRIGAYSEEMNEDDRLLNRLTVQRKKKFQNEGMSSYGNEIPNLVDEDKAKLDSLMDFSSDDERVDATESHFGGGFLKLNKNPKSKQEIMEEVIATSKKKKYEIQLERTENYNLISEVESEWSQVRNQMNFAVRTSPRHVNDNFDSLVKELAYDTRSTSNQDQAKKSEVKKQPSTILAPVHQSHHSLDELNSNKKTIHSSKSKLESLMYNQEGTLISEDFELNENDSEPVAFAKKIQNNEESSKVEDNELKKAKRDILDYLDGGDISDNDESDESDASEVNSSASNELSESEIEMIVGSPPNLVEDSPIIPSHNVHGTPTESIEFRSVSQATSYLDNLVSTIENTSRSEELLFDTCGKIFELLYGLHSIQINPITFLDLITNSLHKISSVDSKYVLRFFLEKLAVCREHLSVYNQRTPSVDEHPNEIILLTLHLVFSLYEMESSGGNLFIRTALSLACESLSKCTFSSATEIGYLLFLTDSILSISSSSLFLPEVITFLTKLLSCSNSPVILNLANSKLDADLIEFNGETQWNIILSPGEYDANRITSALMYNALILIRQYSQLYGAFPCYDEIFSELIHSLVLLSPKENISDKFSHLIQTTLNSLKTFSNNSPKSSLQLLKCSPKTIKFLDTEPIESFTKFKHNSKGSERKSMMRAFKKEFKGAVLEIRKDNAFLSRENFTAQKNKDLQRDRDVKSIKDNIIEERNDKNADKKRKK